MALQSEADTGVVLIRIKRETSQRQNIDSVGIFENRKVSVTRAVSHDMSNTAALTERSAHPHDVMIAPLNINRMVIDKGLHDRIRMRAAIVNIANNMQSLNGQTLNQPTQRFNECRPPASSYNGIDDGSIIRFFIEVARIGIHKLFDDVSEVFGQGFANTRTGVFTRGTFAYGNQTRQHFSVPRSHI